MIVHLVLYSLDGLGFATAFLRPSSSLLPLHGVERSASDNGIRPSRGVYRDLNDITVALPPIL